eukprot:CAMPEP_0168611846 /NCGR_PEP_ID=MMETSP0449_2-20121227/2584_1 /TAXON_ID=1082188 /ORGANISM="Strombidium rassoulzadegani, Strain ras09" /LENGTH=88 /DNA_ID=CAMNT_0008652337 /DNA_START=260 /DNA_END=526 /DNA_ORIENTATION=+
MTLITPFYLCWHYYAMLPITQFQFYSSFALGLSSLLIHGTYEKANRIKIARIFLLSDLESIVIVLCNGTPMKVSISNIKIVSYKPYAY